jgi:hypothetical protein
MRLCKCRSTSSASSSFDHCMIGHDFCGVWSGGDLDLTKEGRKRERCRQSTPQRRAAQRAQTGGCDVNVEEPSNTATNTIRACMATL